MNIRQLTEQAGYRLPAAPQPVGNYRAVIEVGKLVYVSGQMPLLDGELMFRGALGTDLSVQQGQQAAQLSALNLLSQLDQALNGRRIRSLVKVEGYICASDTFTEHAAVLNGASDLLFQVLGEHAGHIRTVIGCSSLPLGAATKVSLIAELD
ncbi:RidA family protein [Aliamphritea spongicola]|uniref:RidA family protein n=1 Tax=Aliamphritea spongicola TaxID=707589 RepID=UPI00196B112D|nr:RidA family protein [Aliamphritea spongicola]MBN3560778.1 RidA family protein [Aliamphritea spongicola]